MADELDMDALALIGAKALIGPHLPVPENARFTLDDLREIRWGAALDQERGYAKLRAHAVLTAIDLPAIIRKAKAEAYEDAASVVERQPDNGISYQRLWRIAAAIRQRAEEEVK